VKNILVILLTGLLCTVQAVAESSVWKIEKGGNSLYLGGSVHILREEDYPLPGEFDLAFDRSDMLVLETDIEQLNNPEVLRRITDQMLLPGNETLRTALDKQTFKELESRCKEYGIPMDMVIKFKPSMAVNALSAGQIKDLGFAEPGVDMYYFSRAKTENKSLGFLESIDTQIDILINSGAGYENEYVRYSLQDLDRTGNVLITLISEWKKGSAKKLESELLDIKEHFPLVYKTMFADRNNAWMRLLETYLDTPAVEFVIAGLGHLHGLDGLLGQLRSRGYRIEQIRAP
jgi:uncharacterized protein YbaP (TraB family)